MSHLTECNNIKYVLNWTGTVIDEEVAGKCYRGTFQRGQEFALVVVVYIITENNIIGLSLEDVLDIAYHSERVAECELMENDYRKAYDIIKETAENMLFLAHSVSDKREQKKWTQWL